MTHGVEVAVGIPAAIAAGTVEEGGGSGDRRKKDGDFAELTKQGSADEIALDAGFLEGFEGDSWLGLRCFEITFEHGTKQRFLADRELPEEIADHGAEEKPPESEGLLQIFQFNWFDAIVEIAEELGRAAESGQSFRRRAAEFSIFENSDAQALQIRCGDSADRHWRRERIARVETNHYREQRAQIADGARHWSDYSDPGESAGAGREVAGGGNAAGRGFESADAAEVRGSADRAAAIAADSSHGTAGGDRSGFATTGAARGIGGIPGIASFAAQAVVGFVGHEEFGSVGVAEEDGTGFFEAGDQWGVGVRDIILAQEGASGTGPAGYIEGRFYGERDSFQGARSFSARQPGFGFAGAGSRGFGVNVGERIEKGLDLLDTGEVRFDEFDGRELFAAEFFESFGDREIASVGHDVKRGS